MSLLEKMSRYELNLQIHIVHEDINLIKRVEITRLHNINSNFRKTNIN